MFEGLYRKKQAPGQATPASCDASEYKPLDFWVGEWKVFLKTTHVGTNKIEKILNGCAIVEHRRDVDGREGKSIFYLDGATWKQLWVTDVGRFKEKRHILTFGDGGVRFQGTVRDAEGRPVLDRTTLTPLARGRVRQIIEQSKDDGETRVAVFDSVYTARRQPIATLSGIFRGTFWRDRPVYSSAMRTRVTVRAIAGVWILAGGAFAGEGSSDEDYCRVPRGGFGGVGRGRQEGKRRGRGFLRADVGRQGGARDDDAGNAGGDDDGVLRGRGGPGAFALLRLGESAADEAGAFDRRRRSQVPLLGRDERDGGRRRQMGRGGGTRTPE